MSGEREILDLLNQRYGQVYGNGPRWSRAEHVKNQLGHYHSRTADYVAVHLWPGIPVGRDHAIVGHEVKVSRSDWLTELRDPEKAEAFRPYMHQWYLVVSDKAIVKPGELPEGWGLMALQGSQLRIIQKAPRFEPMPMPLTMTAALLRATSKTATRIATPPEPTDHYWTCPSCEAGKTDLTREQAMRASENHRIRKGHSSRWGKDEEQAAS